MNAPAFPPRTADAASAAAPPASESRLLAELHARVLAADAVSLDALDTLFIRLVAHPEDVFDLVGLRHHLFGFRARREAAQREAFRVMAAEGRQEIDLPGIYACLPPVGVAPDVLQRSEEEVELAVLRLNPEVAEVLRFARANGKRTALISDMYLGRRFFEELCARDGVEFDHIFVSSDCQATKRDRGALFDQVAQALDLAPERILHIGDNPLGDVQRAQERGFQAVHYRPVQTVSASVPGLDGHVVEGVARSQAYALGRSAWWRSGFAYGGPAVSAVTEWLVERAQADGLSVMLNLARDGYTPHALWPADAAVPSVYLRASRTALTLAAIHDDGFEAHLPFLLSGAHGLTLADVFARIGVEPPAESLLNDLGLSLSQVFDEPRRAAFEGVLRLWRYRILRVCAQARRGLHAYLRQLGLEDGMRVGLFDVGWSGTTQEAFARAVRPFLEVEVHGYYLCLRDDEPTRARRRSHRMSALISTDTHPPDLVQAVWDNRVVSELFFSAPHDSLIGYRLSRTGEVGFVEDPGRGADPRLPAVQRDLVAGAEASADLLRDVAAELALPLSMDARLAPLLHLALHPTREDALALGDLHNFDAWGSSSARQSWMARPPAPGEPLRGDAWPAGLAALTESVQS